MSGILCLASAVAASPAHAASPSFSISTALGQKSVDILSEGDIRPNARPFVFAGIESAYRVAGNWEAAIGGQLGGSFFDFNDPGVSGNVEEVLWSTRLGIDWVHGPDGGKSTYVGIGYEYVETRSWLENRLVSETGPRNILTGISARSGIAWRAWSWMSVTGEIQGSAYRGRAAVPATRARYNWLGRSLGLAIGLRFMPGDGGSATTR